MGWCVWRGGEAGGGDGGGEDLGPQHLAAEVEALAEAHGAASTLIQVG